MKALLTAFRLTFGRAKNMSEIPGVVWSMVGGLVGVVSFITIYVKKAAKPFLFYITLIAGIGMVFYGLYKIFTMRKSTDEEITKKMEQRARGQAPANPPQDFKAYQTQAQQIHRRYPQHTKIDGSNPVSYQGQQHVQHHQVHHAAQQNQAHQASVRYCPNCGQKVHAHQKFCHGCGARLG